MSAGILRNPGHIASDRKGHEAAIRLYEKHGFVLEGRYPRDMKFEDGSYADTVAMGLLVKERPGRS